MKPKYKIVETPCFPNKWKCEKQPPFVNSNETHLYFPTYADAKQWLKSCVENIK